MIFVSLHARQRWVERVDPTATLDQAAAAIRRHTRAITNAARFGCRCVKLGSGAKLVLDGEAVITVLARGSVGFNVPQASDARPRASINHALAVEAGQRATGAAA